MKARNKELRKMETEELEIELKQLRRKHFDLRVQSVTEKITDTSQFLKVRRDVARVMSELARRQTAAKAKQASEVSR
jgi:large subunit ribosomal protein L29